MRPVMPTSSCPAGQRRASHFISYPSRLVHVRRPPSWHVHTFKGCGALDMVSLTAEGMQLVNATAQQGKQTHGQTQGPKGAHMHAPSNACIRHACIFRGIVMSGFFDTVIVGWMCVVHLLNRPGQLSRDLNKRTPASTQQPTLSQQLFGQACLSDECMHVCARKHPRFASIQPANSQQQQMLKLNLSARSSFH